MKYLIPLLLAATLVLGAERAGRESPAAAPGAFRVDASTRSAWAPHGDYLKKLVAVVQARWRVVDQQLVPTEHGTQMVDVLLRPDGRIVLQVDGPASDLQKAACAAIVCAAPFDPWTPEMVQDLGMEQHVTLQFFRNKPAAR